MGNSYDRIRAAGLEQEADAKEAMARRANTRAQKAAASGDRDGLARESDLALRLARRADELRTGASNLRG